jgi:transcriptional regulator with XRE-family HTH domain
MSVGRGDSDREAKGNGERNAFAEEMIAMRADRGWTQEDLAAKMYVSRSTVATIESGGRIPTPAQAREADKAFGTPGTFERHEKRMRGIPFSEGFRPFTPHEAEARLIRSFQHTLMLGLFQTRAYAEAVSELYPETTAEVVKERVDGRMDRQKILDREDPLPPRIHAILDEQVLDRNIGGPEVMIEQLERLIELAMRPRITIQIFPKEKGNAGLLGAFVIAETCQAPAIVYLENALEGTVVESDIKAETMDAVFRAIQVEALTCSASLERLKEARDRWKEQITP